MSYIGVALEMHGRTLTKAGMPETPSNQAERIAKVLARRGVCSRRDAEKLIQKGLVSVDGVTLTSPAVKVSETALIRVSGSVVPRAQETRLWRYHKPSGLVTSTRDAQGRGTVFEHLPDEMPRVISVGRLDLNSEGLLLLTNSGELARRLELPSTGWRRRYRVRVYGRLKPEDLARLTKGIRSNGELLKAEEAILEDTPRGGNTWLTIVLTEGRNREIRRMIEALGGQVNRLIREAYGPFQLGTLRRGDVQEVSRKVMREQLGSLFGDEGGEPKRAAAKRTHADHRR
jgi:23S rRNA pseudouridine2605 synthase